MPVCLPVAPAMPESPLSPELFDFLRELRAHNHRDWFQEHKARYQQLVLDPAVELVRQLEKPLARVAPMLAVVPRRSGGSILRVYRDTRFSKDKTPYKDNLGISLKHQAGRDIHAPGAYLHLGTDESFVAVGCWQPERQTLAAIRSSIDTDPARWLRAKRNRGFASRYELAGSSLKTSPRQFPPDHRMIEDLRRTDFIAVAPWREGDWSADDVIDRIVRDLHLARPLMRFLCDATGVPY